MTFAVDVRAATKTYGAGATAFQALRGVDFAVAPGELVLLSGPSGSGKTTLLSLIGGLLRPTTGSVRLLGRDVTGWDDTALAAFRARHVGFVFQAFNLLRSLSAGENVASMLELRGAPRAAALREARDLLAEVGLGGRFDAMPSDLSGGERQRVAVARALGGSPELILADEPTASLDAKSGRAVAELLLRLSRERGRTVIVVTHDPRIRDLGDRIVALEDGRVVSMEVPA